MDHGEDGGAAVDALAEGHADFNVVGVGQVEFGGGAELDHAVALAALENLAVDCAADNAAGDGAGDLSNSGNGVFARRMMQHDGE